jgi:hypothetical protein
VCVPSREWCVCINDRPWLVESLLLTAIALSGLPEAIARYHPNTRLTNDRQHYRSHFGNTSTSALSIALAEKRNGCCALICVAPPAPSGGETPRKFERGFPALCPKLLARTSSQKQLLRFSLFGVAQAAGPSLAWVVYRGGRKNVQGLTHTNSD